MMMAQTGLEVSIDFHGILAMLSRVVTPIVVRRYSSSLKKMVNEKCECNQEIKVRAAFTVVQCQCEQPNLAVYCLHLVFPSNVVFINTFIDFFK
jgi:hypothetical protein